MNLPIVIKIILNIIFYIVYVLVFSILFGLIIWFIINYLGKPVISETTASIIQWGLAILVLFITIIARKYFYISFDKKERIEEKNINKVEKKSSNDELEITIGK